MIKYYLLVIFSFLLPRIHGQNPELVALANQLTKGLTDDSLKVVAISDWIIDNISYDWDSYNDFYLKSKPMPDKCYNVDIIVKTKLAVCGGYANFFKELCRLSNIKAEYIVGYVQSDTEIIHAWNAVKVNGRWYLLDLTWADNGDLPIALDDQMKMKADSIEAVLFSEEMKKEVERLMKIPPTKAEEDLFAFIESVLTLAEKDSLRKADIKNRDEIDQMVARQKKFDPAPRKRYQWADPSIFLADHLPQDPIWQLVAEETSYEDFMTLIWKSNWFDKEPNFGKSVIEEESLDNIQRIYKSIQRRLKFRKDDVWTIQDAALFFKKRGDEQCINLFSGIKDNKLTLEMRSKLEKSKNYYLRSNAYFEQLKSKEPFKETVRLNLIYNQVLIAEIDKYLQK